MAERVEAIVKASLNDALSSQCLTRLDPPIIGRRSYKSEGLGYWTPRRCLIFVSATLAAINSLESQDDQSAAQNKELHMNLVTLNLTQSKTRASRRGLFSEVT